MARYKPVEYAQGQFISIAFEHQILPVRFSDQSGHRLGAKRPLSRTKAATVSE
jgi:hypothetical protein